MSDAALRMFAVSCACVFLSADSLLAQAKVEPPIAPRKPHSYVIHGEKRTDDYFWLREKKNPEVIEYLKAENAYTEAFMSPTKALQDRIYQEFLSRTKQSDTTAPYRQRKYWYYRRMEKDKQYPIYCRRFGSMDGPEEVMIDVNEMAKGEKFLSVIPVGVSDDDRMLAFLTDTTGFREYMLSEIDLATKTPIDHRFVKARTAAWCTDNKTLFYVTEDEAKRPNKLWRHTIGQPVGNDVLVFEEKDQAFELVVRATQDRKYLVRHSHSSDTTEEAFIDASKPACEWTVVLPRKKGHEYQIEHAHGYFYIRTNSNDAKNFRVATVPVAQCSNQNAWQAYLPHNPDALVEQVLTFSGHVAVAELERAVPHIRVLDIRTGENHRIEFPDPVRVCYPSANLEFETSTLRFAYSSPTTPRSDFDYDMRTRALTLVKREEIPAGHDPTKYTCERIEATASDGVKVPISVVYRRDFKRDGKAACLLYGYGSYGATTDTSFDQRIFSLLDRGMVFAIGHIRGSNDLGRAWYENGKLMHKKNTFTDFVACADHLVKENYCSRDRLAIQGGSAGGLLVGATLNLRPDLCKAAILEVPFVDVVNTMLDDSLPLTTQEYLEWGNPNVKQDFDYIKSYCPYSNLRKTNYPTILVTTSLNDSQVLYHEPAKYVAKLRTLKTDSNPLIFKCNMDAGHGGASGRYDALKEDAFVAAFVLTTLGVESK